MNPFLFSTVAKPLNDTSRLRKPWSKALAAASIATLAWAGNAAAVNLNTATVIELQNVRGIGPKTAQIIIQERDRAGAFESFEDLSDRVRGIGPKKAQSLQAAGLEIDNTTSAKSQLEHKTAATKEESSALSKLFSN